MLGIARRQTAAAVASAARRAAVAPKNARAMSGDMDAYGSQCFVGAVADKYLKKHGESAALLEDPSWVSTKADKVAAALKDWGMDHGATCTAHWFQPLGSNEVRPGMSGMVINHFFAFHPEKGNIEFKYDGETLVKGETDGSSYPNGGLRATHTAGGYTIIDPTSPIFMRGDTIHIPCVFISWTGHALDEKTPLLRAEQAMSREGVRLLKNLGYNVKGLQSNIGLEQEFFLIPRDSFARRLDLQMTGRTILGKNAPRGQEMCDHYFAPLNPNAQDCIKAIQEEAFNLGISLKTRHREVAPNQYEMAPYFGRVTQQVDQNLVIMQLCEEIAARYNLACLFQEKPFADINGSGKHNNWSIGTKCGVNLLNAKQVEKASGSPLTFPIVLAAIISGVDKHGDLMRAAISAPGNDFRLGACEAPPAVISAYLGASVTNYLDDFRQGKAAAYNPAKKMLSSGVDVVPDFEVPAVDRNRTSPFPFGGHRFEFRAVGSSQNVSMVNTVLATISAQAFAEFSDAIEAGKKPEDVAKEALNKHWRVIFDGNGYDPAWLDEANKRGIWRIDSGVDAINMMGSDKNVKLFSDMKVLSKEELDARRDIMLQHYAGIVEMEALCFIDMLKQQVIPAIKEAEQDTKGVEGALKAVKDGLAAMHHEGDDYKKAALARVLRLETMISAREAVDAAEGECPAHLWPLATYKEMLFLDANQDANGNTI
jgi:glutamine synthetase